MLELQLGPGGCRPCSESRAGGLYSGRQLPPHEEIILAQKAGLRAGGRLERRRGWAGNGTGHGRAGREARLGASGPASPH